MTWECDEVAYQSCCVLYKTRRGLLRRHTELFWTRRKQSFTNEMCPLLSFDKIKKVLTDRTMEILRFLLTLLGDHGLGK